MIHHFVFVLALIATTSGQFGQRGSDCKCRVPVYNRVACSVPYPVNNRYQCQRGGCCWNRNLLSFSNSCYQGDETQCGGLFSRSSCRMAFPIQPCGGVVFGNRACAERGCCYNPESFPYCFVKAFDNVPSFNAISEWSAWSSCSSSCSSGKSTRTRQCLNPDPRVCISQNLQLTQSERCNSNLCDAWSDWADSSCSKTCGSGFSTQTRSCLRFGALGPTECYTITSACNVAQCFESGPFSPFFPVAAAWGEWQNWGACPVRCAPAKRTRTRLCYLNGDPAEARSCRTDFFDSGTSVDSQDCNLEMCTFWTTWASFTQCTQTCGETLTRLSSRACQGFAPNAAVTDAFTECSRREEPCNLAPCPGIQPLRPTAPSGFFKVTEMTDTATPPASIKTTQTTSERNVFSVFFKITEMTDTATPMPSIETPPTTLERNVFVFTPTNDAELITESTTFNFLPFTASSVRTIFEPTPFVTTLQSPTTTSTTTTTTDSTSTEPQGPYWDVWTTWSACTATCGERTRVRVRICRNSEGTLTEDSLCSPRSSFEAASCSDRPCPPATTSTASTSTTSTTTVTSKPVKETAWGPWLSWTECSSTCSPGLRVRARVCKNSDGTDEETEACGAGSLLDEDSCNEKLCTDWTDWSKEECSISCVSDEGDLPGITVRSRQCLVVEEETAEEKCYVIATLCNATKPCPGEESTPGPSPMSATTAKASTTSTESTTQKPATPPRSRPGLLIWADWGDWSECSETCSSGIQNRARSCLPDVPPQFCVEGALDSRRCNTGSCMSWSDWRSEPCDKTCGEGGQRLTRRICLSGQNLDPSQESCYKSSQPCGLNPQCEDEIPDPKLDVLFLVDSSTHVDDCETIEEETGLELPIRGKQLNSTIAPTYTRMKKFITDFVRGWRGISDDGTRISIQLFSNLCSPKTKSNLHVEKRFNESHEQLVAQYIEGLPYLCGEYWLDWALQCAINPVMTTSFGDRKDVPNVVVALLSNAPTTSQPSDLLLGRILKQIVGKGSTVLSATVTPLETLGPRSRQRYEENMRKIACKKGQSCSAYLGSIWSLDNSEVGEAIRQALVDAGKI